MRFWLALSLLTLACSTKHHLPADDPGDSSSDVLAEHGGPCVAGYPCCIFAVAGTSGQCSLDTCIVPDAGDTPPDADSFGCPVCGTGYACGILCPSPNGGCGPPGYCCRVP